ITHGIVGALIGKGYFSERHGRVATFAAAAGAMFPDIDIVEEIFSHDPLAIVKYHRGITHSFVALPFFAAILAWLTRAGFAQLKKRFTGLRDIESPSWAILFVIYAIAIASHIILDAMTSFGTRIWDPFSQERVAWDVLFIIDFSFTSIALLPQVIAWICTDPAKARVRAISMWALFTVAAFIVWKIADAVGFPFHLWIAFFSSVIIAALFFLPAVRGAGFRVTTERWCQAGVYAMLAYLFACSVAHHQALLRVKQFASLNNIPIDRIAALPLPPSLLDWGGVIRSVDGVYQSRFDLRDSSPPLFSYTADSPPNMYVALAMQRPEVQIYWNFARFPVIRTYDKNGLHYVDFNENRFITRKTRGPAPFSYRIVFDDAGNPLEEGWQASGMDMRRMIKIPPAHTGSAP
ncbi:MAG: metal-dependent hydrolase, partial [Candidatus Acidiferrales bacterium]